MRLYISHQDAPTEQARASASLHGQLAGKRAAVHIGEPNREGVRELEADYAPCIRAPGFYTPRLALDDVSEHSKIV